MNSRDIELAHLDGEQRELAECIGIDAYRTLSQAYGGGSVYVAKAEAILKDERDRRIFREYNGRNVHALALKYSLADNTVRKIIRSYRACSNRKEAAHEL